MYTAFYGLREKPFALSPDPRFLFLAASHREALAHVLYGVEQGEGFIAVTGEVGTGKTTLCRTLLERLGPDTEVAFVFNPTLSGEDLLRAICTEFGLLTEGRTRAELSDQLNQFLLEQKREHRRVLLIVDEAQNLPAETLEEIRLLSNLETATSKLIQILLFGQPELDDKLDSKQLRQLRQRISVRWSLGSLSSSETREYVRHRLRVAAQSDPDIFSSRALSEVHRRARGIPRLVNLLCDRALLAGYAAGERRVGPDLVGVAAREILGARRRLLRRRPWLRRTYVAGAALVLLASGALAWQQWTHVEPRVVVDSTPSVSTPPVGAAGAHAVEPAVAPPPFIGPPQAHESRDAG
jgi:general secretion pathway protein A